MAPTPATSALAYIKQCKPVLRGEVSKVAYLMHTYAVMSDCTLVGLDQRPGMDRGRASWSLHSAAAFGSLPAVLSFQGATQPPIATEKWQRLLKIPHMLSMRHDMITFFTRHSLQQIWQIAGSSSQEVEMPAELEKQDFASLHYRTPSGALIEIAVMRADNELLLHWASYSGDQASESSPIHSVSIPQGKYFTDSANGADAYDRERVPELMDKFTAGLDLLLQADDSTAAAPQGNTESRPQQVDRGRPDSMPDIPPVQPLHVIHPQVSPLMDGIPRHGGSHVGPDDPMFAGVVHGRQRFGSAVNPPGARFDPIAPDGLPGSHPDDFLGPGQADGWHDLGPPPGRNMPGRGFGPGNNPFGGFM